MILQTGKQGGWVNEILNSASAQFPLCTPPTTNHQPSQQNCYKRKIPENGAEKKVRNLASIIHHSSQLTAPRQDQYFINILCVFLWESFEYANRGIAKNRWAYKFAQFLCFFFFRKILLSYLFFSATRTQYVWQYVCFIFLTLSNRWIQYFWSFPWFCSCFFSLSCSFIFLFSWSFLWSKSCEKI